MKNNILRPMLASLALGATLVSATALPAKADSAATTRLLAGAAAAAAIFTAVNVEHKHQLATTIQGYLPNGSAVYADGHVVSPDGTSWYPGNNGEQVACNGNQQCSITGNYRYGNLNGYEESGGNGWRHRH